MKKLLSYIGQNKTSLAIKIFPALAILGLSVVWPLRPVEATVESMTGLFTDTKPDPVQEKKDFFAPAISKLLAAGADKDFIDGIMSDSNTRFQERLVKINVTGYRKPADYSHNYSPDAIAQSRDFLAQNREILGKAAEKYEVPEEAIAAILWVETKQGRITGSNHLPSVFLSVAMSDQEEFIQKNIDVVRTEFPDTTVKAFTEAVDKIRARARKKSSWAVNELVFLQKMEREKGIPVGTLYGSWAGAFGWSQFLPSSYIRSAVDGDGDGKANLFTLKDAAHSIGNYLRKAGWDASLESRRKAVFNYNNSNDYVDAVLKHAELIGAEKSLIKDTKKKLKKKRSQKLSSKKKIGKKHAAVRKKAVRRR